MATVLVRSILPTRRIHEIRRNGDGAFLHAPLSIFDVLRGNGLLLCEGETMVTRLIMRTFLLSVTLYAIIVNTVTYYKQQKETPKKAV